MKITAEKLNQMLTDYFSNATLDTPGKTLSFVALKAIKTSEDAQGLITNLVEADHLTKREQMESIFSIGICAGAVLALQEEKE